MKNVDNSKSRWRGWIIIFVGTAMLIGFVLIQYFLKSAGAVAQPVRAIVAPALLCVLVIASGVVSLLRNAK